MEAVVDIEIQTGIAEVAGLGDIVIAVADWGGCNYLANHLLLPGQYAEVSQICNLIVSSSAPPTTVTPSQSASPPPTSNAPVTTSGSAPPSSSSGPSIPSTEGDQCASCQLSVYYLGVEGLAAQCHVSSPVLFGNDLSVVLCDSSYNGKYAQFCSEICANPCVTYDAQSWMESAGASFMANANLATCNQLCPGFKGDGKCTESLPCNECGKGSGTCVPCSCILP